jgi:ATP-dependent exoDNAse (exonuclease V) beta subunit
MQWNNFVPLLDETLSRGEESMIVGDVKQSIYRWRNGDWTILHKDVEERFRRKVEFAPPLDKNFRSGQYVIEFNNMLFDVGDGENGQEKLSLPYWFDCELGKRQINSEFRAIYSGSKQIVGKSKNPKGYVRAEFFEKNDEFTCQEQSLNRMVEEMLRLGHYGEMAVLVRKNTEAAIVAERLQQEGIPFYSTEALCVAENIAVRFIVAVLYFLMQPTEHLYRANLLALYCELFFKRDINADDFELLSYKGEDYEDWMRRLVGDDEKVGRFVQIKNLSLLSLIDGIIDIFDLNGIDDGVYAIYIQSFMDRVRKFAIDGMLDIRSLLEYWGQCGDKAFISMPEGGNAVRIMTIHTSKGLEFGIVFIPFMNWVFGIAKLDHIELAQTIEKRSDGHIFDENVPIVPINYINSRLLLNSFFDVDIKEEFLATCLDTMNVLYVSTTRASQQLYIHCYEPSGNYSKEDSAIRPIFAVTALRAVLMDGDNEKSVFELGDSSDYEQKEKEGEDEEVENVELWCGSCQKDDSQGDKERISWRFTYSEDNKLKQDGVLMHRLFQQIVVVEDVDRAIESFLHDGEIVESEVEKFRKQINSVLSIEGVVDFFDSKWQVWNEATIFDVEKREECRPDRIMLDDELKQAVVLDYKFGYVEKESYKSQVERYVKLLTKMGYATQGYILYAKKRKLVKI